MVQPDLITPLVTTTWDKEFVQRPEFRVWLQDQLVQHPIPPGWNLLSYVTERLKAASTQIESEQRAVALQAQQEDASMPGGITPMDVVQSSSSLVVQPEAPPQMTIDPSQLMSPPIPARAPSPLPSAAPKPPSKAKKEAKEATPPVASSSKAKPAPATKAGGKKPGVPWARAYTQLKTHLDAKSLAAYPNRSAKALVETLEQYGPGSDSSVPAAARADILKLLLDRGTPEFFAALHDQPHLRDLLQAWTVDAIRAAVAKGKQEGKDADHVWASSLIPALKLWDTLPIPAEQLSTLQMVPRVYAVAKEFAKDSPFHDRETFRVAFALAKKWKAMVADGPKTVKADPKRKSSDSLSVDEELHKKRKVSPSSSVATGKPAASSSTSKPAVTTKAAPKPTVPASGLAGVGLKGLNFSKKAAGAASDAKNPSFLPESGSKNAFAEAMSSLQSKAPAPPPASTSRAHAAPVTGANAGKASSLARGKKRVAKKVTWRADEDLVQVKLIEPAVYDDDLDENGDVRMGISTMDQNEGAALYSAHHNDEDKLPWTEPLSVLVEMSEEDAKLRAYPRQEPIFAFGASEVDVQTAREANVPEFVCENQNDAPWTPTEPAVEVVDPSVAKQMDIGVKLGNDVDYKALLSSARQPRTLATDPEISSLLAQLSNNVSAAPVADPLGTLLSSITQANASLLTPPGGYPYPDATMRAPLPSYAGPAPGPSSSRGSGNGYGSRPAYRDRSKPPPAIPGRPDRRGNVPCKFFMKGECMYGDTCPFQHVRF